MCSAIDQATRLTTRGGGRSRSNSARQEDSLLSASSRRWGITLPATSLPRCLFRAAVFLALLLCVFAAFASPALAQIPVPSPVPPPPGQDNTSKRGSTIITNVNLVVLHTTVLDDRQRFADRLQAGK